MPPAEGRPTGDHLNEPAVDIGILTIRDDEFEAVLAVLPDEAGFRRGKHREYTLRYADAGNGDRYLVAILKQIEQGNGEAQDAARDMIDDLKPSLILVVGIGGGLPSEDITLGDVVVSTRINDYNVAARKFDEEPTFSLQGGPVSKKLAGCIGNLAGRSEMDGWSSGLPDRPRVTWHRKQNLYGPDTWRERVRKSLKAHFPDGSIQRVPKFAAGPIASSDSLVKDPKVLFPWIQTARHLLAVEMESGGAYRAARDRCPMLAVRALSDIVGLNRDDAWTKYACRSAAAFTRAFLSTRPVDLRRSPRAQGTRNASKKPAPPQSETLFANLLPLADYPKVVFVAPATITAYKPAWKRLREEPGRAPRGWVLHEKLLYSLSDPEQSSLSTIADVGGIEEHDIAELADSNEREKMYIFVQLLTGALHEDLGLAGVRFFGDDEVFAFAGRLGEENRTYTYKNVHQRSTMTVVFHYEHKAKSDGKVTPYLRHLAMDCRFRRVDGRWLLEFRPTYRFTSDGKFKFRFHEDKLKGIKRFEGNRAVLSQVLLWSDVLTGASAGSDGHTRLLRFGSPLQFQVDAQVSDQELTAMDLPDQVRGRTSPADDEDGGESR